MVAAMTLSPMVIRPTSRPLPDCDRHEGTTEGAVRLRGGFGTLCDPVHSGFIEVLHFDEWGSVCTDQRAENRAEDNLVADVVCRQLGFPHGTRIDPLTSRPPPSPPDGEAPSPYTTYYYSSYYDYDSITEEAEEPVDRFWLSEVTCSGPEGRLIDCDLGEGFRNNNAGCSSRPHRIHIACRQFPVVEALEEVTTPDAGALHQHTPGPHVHSCSLFPPMTILTIILHYQLCSYRNLYYHDSHISSTVLR